MAANQTVMQALLNAGVPVGAAAVLADPATDALSGGTVADQGALTAAASVAAPTKAEFDKVVADAVTARNKLNELLAALRTAGVIS